MPKFCDDVGHLNAKAAHLAEATAAKGDAPAPALADSGPRLPAANLSFWPGYTVANFATLPAKFDRATLLERSAAPRESG
jgi:hypothetical protein